MHKNLKFLLKITTRKKFLRWKLEVHPIRLQKLPIINNSISKSLSSPFIQDFFVQILIV